jgi:hypothetical protein
MYACSALIYGVDLSEVDYDTWDPALVEEIESLDGDFYSSPYTGWVNHDPRAIGFCYGGVEECDEDYEEMGYEPGDSGVNPADFGQTRPLAEYHTEFDGMFKTLSPALQSAVLAVGTPGFFLLWSTS